MLIKARGLEGKEEAHLQGQREKVSFENFSKRASMGVHTVGGKGRCCCELIEPVLKFLYQRESLCHTLNFHFPLGHVGLTMLTHSL